MERKNLLTIGSIVVLAVVALLIWNLPENGTGLPIIGQFVAEPWSNPWDSADTAAATASAQEWLSTDSGIRAFNNATAGDAVPVFSEDREISLWLIPVKDSEGLYPGFIQAESEDFEAPLSYLKYPEPLDAFISRDIAIDMHTYFILKYGTDYAPEQISEPFVVMKSDGGYFWMSEIAENGQVVETLFSEIRLVD
jgi:hypothetical protein